MSLQVPARTVLRTDERGLPVGEEPVEGTDYDFLRARPIGTTKLDHAFTTLSPGDDGLVRVQLRAAGGDGFTLWVEDSYRYLMVFSGDTLPNVNRRSVAVEPMMCPPNTFRTGTNVIRLEPGESCTGVWGIRAMKAASN